MNRPLVVGSASGLVSSLALTLLKDLASGVEPSLENFHHCFDCPEDPTTKAFLTGLTVGLLVWPLIDILQVLRSRWRRFVLRQLAQTSSPTVKSFYKVLA